MAKEDVIEIEGIVNETLQMRCSRSNLKMVMRFQRMYLEKSGCTTLKILPGDKSLTVELSP